MATNNSVNTPLSGTTGTGNFVGATSPTLVTPTIGAATATSVTFSPTTGGIVGTTTNNNTTAGNVGEVVTSTVTYASNTGISNATPTDITSISLTAGDWDVFGTVGFEETAVGFNGFIGGWISTTSATLPNAELRAYSNLPAAAGQSSVNFAVPTVRLSLSTTTTVYLSGRCDFAAGAARMFGVVTARRRR